MEGKYMNGLSKTMAFYTDDADNADGTLTQSRTGSESPPYHASRFASDGQDFSNEISAPYEVPQFPIEQIEKKLAIQRQITVKVLEDKRSHYEPSLVGALDEQDHLVDEDHDFVPHFQRVSISGEDTSGVPLEDLERASRLLVTALKIRHRYMQQSHQSFCTTTSRFLHPDSSEHAEQKHDDKQTIEAEVKNNSTQVNGSLNEYAMKETASDEIIDIILQNKDPKGNHPHSPAVVRSTLSSLWARP